MNSGILVSIMYMLCLMTDYDFFCDYSYKHIINRELDIMYVKESDEFVVQVPCLPRNVENMFAFSLVLMQESVVEHWGLCKKEQPYVVIYVPNTFTSPHSNEIKVKLSMMYMLSEDSIDYHIVSSPIHNEDVVEYFLENGFYPFSTWHDEYEYPESLIIQINNKNGPGKVLFKGDNHNGFRVFIEYEKYESPRNKNGSFLFYYPYIRHGHIGIDQLTSIKVRYYFLDNPMYKNLDVVGHIPYDADDYLTRESTDDEMETLLKPRNENTSGRYMGKLVMKCGENDIMNFVDYNHIKSKNTCELFKVNMKKDVLMHPYIEKESMGEVHIEVKNHHQFFFYVNIYDVDVHVEELYARCFKEKYLKDYTQLPTRKTTQYKTNRFFQFENRILNHWMRYTYPIKKHKYSTKMTNTAIGTLPWDIKPCNLVLIAYILEK